MTQILKKNKTSKNSQSWMKLSHKMECYLKEMDKRNMAEENLVLNFLFNAELLNSHGIFLLNLIILS